MCLFYMDGEGHNAPCLAEYSLCCTVMGLLHCEESMYGCNSVELRSEERLGPRTE